MATTTVTVSMSAVRLTLGKKSYDYSAELYLNNQLLESPQFGKAAAVKAGVEGTIIYYCTDTQPLRLQFPGVKLGSTTLTLNFVLHNKKSATDVKKYEKAQDINITPNPAPFTVVFGDIGSITFTVTAMTAEQIVAKAKYDEEQWRLGEIRKGSTALEGQLGQLRTALQQTEKSERDMLVIKEKDARAKKQPPQQQQQQAVPRGGGVTATTAAAAAATNNNNTNNSPTGLSTGRNNTPTRTGNTSAGVTPRGGLTSASSNLPSPSAASTTGHPISPRGVISGQQQQPQYYTSSSNTPSKTTSSPNRYRSAGAVMSPMELLQDDEESRRAQIEQDERANIGITRAAGNAHRRRAASPKAAGNNDDNNNRSPSLIRARSPQQPRRTLNPLQIIQRQETATRDKVMHDERVSFLQMKSAAGGDRRRRDIRERDMQARAEMQRFNVSPRRQQQQQQAARSAVDPRLLEPDYYLGNRVVTNIMLQQQMQAEYYHHAQQQQQFEEQQRQEAIMFGGMMMSPDRPISPRSRPHTFHPPASAAAAAAATSSSSSGVVHQQPQRAYYNINTSPSSDSAALRRPLSPRQQMQEELRQHREQQRYQAEQQQRNAELDEYYAQEQQAQEAEEEERQFQQQQQQQMIYRQQQQQRLLPATPLTPDTSTWTRLVNRCRYAPAMTERELIKLEWITLRDMAINLGFVDHDDLIDLYEAWRERNSNNSNISNSSPSPRSRRTTNASTVLSPSSTSLSPNYHRPRPSTSRQNSQRRGASASASSSPRQRAEAIAAAVLAPPLPHYAGTTATRGNRSGDDYLYEYAPPERDGSPAASSILMRMPGGPRDAAAKRSAIDSLRERVSPARGDHNNNREYEQYYSSGVAVHVVDDGGVVEPRRISPRRPAQRASSASLSSQRRRVPRF